MGKNESNGSDLAQQSSAPLAVVEPFADMYAMQMDISSRLTQLTKNIKKDGQIKKTKSYYEFRLNNLNELSKQFYTNHQALISQQCPRSHPYFADAVEDNFEQAYSHIYCSFADEYETKFPVPIQVSGDQSINNIFVSSPVSTIQLSNCPYPAFQEILRIGHLFMTALRS